MAASSGSKNQKIGSNSKALATTGGSIGFVFLKAQSQATIEKVSKRGRHARLTQKRATRRWPHVLRWVSLLRALRRSELYCSRP